MEDKEEFIIKHDTHKRCWLFELGCPYRTGCCFGLPDNGCPTYRWFKEVVKYNNKNRPEKA